MNNWISIARLIIVAALLAYEFWTYRKGNTFKRKLIPIVFLAIIGFVFMSLAPFLGVIVAILAIQLIELSLMCSMLVVIVEVIFTLIGSRRSFKKILQLCSVFLLLAAIYYLGERVF